jgi:hypothetical protein
MMVFAAFCFTPLRQPATPCIGQGLLRPPTDADSAVTEL